MISLLPCGVGASAPCRRLEIAPDIDISDVRRCPVRARDGTGSGLCGKRESERPHASQNMVAWRSVWYGLCYAYRYNVPPELPHHFLQRDDCLISHRTQPHPLYPGAPESAAFIGESL